MNLSNATIVHPDEFLRPRACFIAFEGIDGSGKSSLVDALAAYLRSNGKSVLVNREPGTTPLGQGIRKLLKSDVDASRLSELMLQEASRADIVEKCIRPNLQRFDYIINDRYIESTCAYQGAGNGTAMETIHTLNDIATGGLTPDFSFLVDVPLELAQKRLHLRGASPDYFDSHQDFAKRVYDYYQTADLIKIDNSGRLEDALNEILTYLESEK